jgi:fibrillarin-like rRNA methylase
MSADTDYKFFTENLDVLYKEYGHKFLVIKNRTVISTYDTLAEAFHTTAKTEALGTFIIQECVNDSMKLVHSFHGNVTFA